MTGDGQVPAVLMGKGESTTQGGAVTNWTCQAPPEHAMRNLEYRASATAKAIASAGVIRA